MDQAFCKQGTRVEVLPAYNSMTCRRDLYDEFAGVVGNLKETLSSGDTLIETDSGHEFWIARKRLVLACWCGLRPHRLECPGSYYQPV